MDEIRTQNKVDEMNGPARKPEKIVTNENNAPVVPLPMPKGSSEVSEKGEKKPEQTSSVDEITHTQAPLLVLDHVSKTYPGDYTALDDVSLTINAGEFVSIVGMSGAGKSTLLKMIYAQEQPTEGAVFLNGRPVAQIKRRLLPYYRRNFGTVFQDFKLLPKKTVFENVAFALEVDGASTEQINEEVPKMLAIVGLKTEADKLPYQVSGGEEQRASLARALIHRPKVLIADEPTGNLDPMSTAEMIELLQAINGYGTTIILATHDKTVVDEVQRRVILMDKGKIVRDQTKAGYGLA